MGYTHYMYQSRDLTQDEWTKFCGLVSEIFAATDVPLANWAGVAGSFAEIGPERVAFNGVGADGCETCCVTRERDKYQPDPGVAFSFTKTRRRPYDAAVIAVYRAARDVAPDAFELGSDGGEEIFDAE